MTQDYRVGLPAPVAYRSYDQDRGAKRSPVYNPAAKSSEYPDMERCDLWMNALQYSHKKARCFTIWIFCIHD